MRRPALIVSWIMSTRLRSEEITPYLILDFAQILADTKYTISLYSQEMVREKNVIEVREFKGRGIFF